MPYRVTISDQATYTPIGGTAVFTDFDFKEIGRQDIPVSGADLNTNWLADAFALRFTSPGYYDFDADPFHLPEGGISITLDKKPSSVLVHYGIGAVIGYLIGKVIKF